MPHFIKYLPFLIALCLANIVFAGQTGSNDPNANRTCDSSDAGDCKSDSGMPVYSFKSMLASLSLRDTPLNYTPPIGGSIKFSLFYNAREARQNQPAKAANIGPNWTSNWISYIEDNPVKAGDKVFRFVAGGGGEEYTGFTASTGKFAPHEHQGAQLIRQTSPDLHYEMHYNDGRIDVFAISDNSASYPRRFYLSQQIDAQGNSIKLHYDEHMRLTQIEDAIGQISELHYQNSEFPLAITQISDPFGRSAQLQYDGQGRLTAITDAIGMTSSFTYAGSGTFINSMTTPYGTTTFKQSQKVGSPTQASIQATDPLGYTERTEYRHSAPGIAFSESHVPGGLNLRNNYMNYRNSFYWNKRSFDEACTLGGSRDAECDYSQAAIKHFLHNAKGETASTLESVKAPLERRIWFTYAGQSNSIYTGTLDSPSTVARVLDNGQTQKSHLVYNAQGRISQSIDPQGRTTYYRYAANGIDMIEIQQQGEQGLETLASLTWNDQHLPLSITDAAGQTTTYSYNAQGQITQIRNALGQATQYQYDNKGYLLTISNTEGRIQQQFTYDNVGRVASVTDSEGYTQRFAYDALNRLTQTTYPDNSKRTIVWDRLDIAEVIDREGHKTQYQYDANRNLVKTIDALGQETHYNYYPDGSLRTLTDANGNITTWQRDIQGRVVSKTYNDGQGDSFSYDSAGRLITQTDAKGQTIHYAYATDNQLTQVDYANSLVPTPTVSFTFDSYYPRLTQMTDGHGTTLYHYYDVGELGAGQIKEESNAAGQITHSYLYDALGRATQETHAGGIQNQQYDALGRIFKQSNALGSFALQYLGDSAQLIKQQSLTTPYQIQIGYENNQQDRRLKSLHHAVQETYQPTLPWPLSWLLPKPAPITTDKPVIDFDFASTAEGRISQRQISEVPEDKKHHHHHGIGHLLAWLLGYQPHSTQASLNGTTHYQYDVVGHLLSAVQSGQEQAGYESDAVDNLVEIRQGNKALSLIANGLNQIDSIESQNYQYDANGNLLNDGQRSYQWDAADRLIQITDLQTGQTSEFAYDGYSRRITETEKDANGNITKQLNNLWCGESLCAQQDENGQTINRFFTQGEVQNGQAYLYAQDQVGNVYALIDSQGKVAGRTAYDPYGNITYQTGTQPIMAYAGLYRHDASNLYLATYRAYNPATARWLNRDPIREMGGLNIYAYVGGDPINFVDPNGLSPTVGIPVGSFGFGGATTGTATSSHLQSGSISAVSDVVHQQIGATYDFASNYADMQRANWKQSDKYFHCKANCEASKRGGVGKSTACEISDWREDFDQGKPWYSWKNDTPAMSALDQAANLHGRDGANSSSSCTSICAKYRPNGLPSIY